MDEAQDKNANGSSVKELFYDVLDLVEVGLGTFFVFLILMTYVFRPVLVTGSSMVPTLRNGDSLLMMTMPPVVKPGKIVIIDDQKAGAFADAQQTQVVQRNGYGTTLVKRVIAVGGQELNIDFENGTVAVDGKQLAESYIADLTKRDDGGFTYPLTVPEGYIFVMGDNRMHSTDSRSPIVGLVPEDQVLGTVVMRYNREDETMTSWFDRFDFLFW